MKSFPVIVLIVTLFASLGMRAAQNENKTEVKAEFSIVELLDSTPGVTIIQPQALSDRLKKSEDKKADTQTADNTKPGNKNNNVKKNNDTRQPAETKKDKDKDKPQKPGSFSIEVYSDNSKDAKEQATKRRQSVQSRFPQYPASLRFDSPFWRVRVGNFRTREDAESAMANIRRAFPSFSAYMRIIGR